MNEHAALRVTINNPIAKAHDDLDRIPANSATWGALRGLLSEWDTLTAEVERLRGREQELLLGNTHARAEVERLRLERDAALSESRQSSANASVIAAERDTALAQLADRKNEHKAAQWWLDVQDNIAHGQADMEDFHKAEIALVQALSTSPLCNDESCGRVCGPAVRLTQEIRDERDQALAQLAEYKADLLRIAEALGGYVLQADGHGDEAADTDTLVRVIAAEKARADGFAKERDEWADAIRTVAPGCIASPFVARTAIGHLKALWESEKARADEAARRAEVRFQDGYAAECELNTERAAREKAEAREALLDQCLSHYQARFIVLYDAWRNRETDNQGALDALRLFVSAQDNDHAHARAEQAARDHTVAEAAREWANFVKLNPSRWENKSDRVLLAAIGGAP